MVLSALQHYSLRHSKFFQACGHRPLTRPIDYHHRYGLFERPTSYRMKKIVFVSKILRANSGSLATVAKVCEHCEMAIVLYSLQF